MDDTTRDAIQGVLDRQITDAKHAHGHLVRSYIDDDVLVLVFFDGRWAWIEASEDDGCAEINAVQLQRIDEYAARVLANAGAIDIETRNIIDRHWSDKTTTATMERERKRLFQLIVDYPEDARRILSDNESGE